MIWEMLWKMRRLVHVMMSHNNNKFLFIFYLRGSVKHSIMIWNNNNNGDDMIFTIIDLPRSCSPSLSSWHDVVDGSFFLFSTDGRITRYYILLLLTLLLFIENTCCLAVNKQAHWVVTDMCTNQSYRRLFESGRERKGGIREKEKERKGTNCTFVIHYFHRFSFITIIDRVHTRPTTDHHIIINRPHKTCTEPPSQAHHFSLSLSLSTCYLSWWQSS